MADSEKVLSYTAAVKVFPKENESLHCFHESRNFYGKLTMKALSRNGTIV